MPDENEQVALEDSANEENEEEVTADAGTSTKTATAPEEAPPDEGTAEAAPDETEADAEESESAASADADADESESAASADAEAEQSSAATATKPAPPVSRTSQMAGVGGAMLVVSVVILVAAVVIAMSSRKQPVEPALINEYRTSMDEITRKLSEIEAKTESAPAIIIGEVGNFDDFTRMMKVGNTQSIEGHFEEAAQSYEAAITLDPSGKLSDEAHYRLGICRVKTGQTEDAIREFRFVVQNYPGSRHYAASALEMGELLMARKNFSQARRLFYMVLGSESRLSEDQQAVLERTYYAIARAYEDEAVAVEATRYNPETALDFGVKTGETR